MTHKSCARPYQNDAKYECACHKQMGNDFWFLPTESCLFKREEAKR